MKLSALQLHISLRGVKPQIYRRVIVSSSLSLDELHRVIQSVMPWDDDHQFFFRDGKIFYDKDEDYDTYYVVRVGDLLTQEGKSSILYEYDMCDSWQHDILLEKILPSMAECRAKYIDGEMAAPPEDCGGAWGYEELIEVLKNPEHPDYEEKCEWCEWVDIDPQNFNPTVNSINIKKLNRILAKI